jgi:hypothetical protein
MISRTGCAALLVLATIAMPLPAGATADGCAVVRNMPDGFLNLRKAPRTDASVVTQLRPGDRLDVDTAHCQTVGEKSICADKGWTHVISVRRMDRNKSETTNGWVVDRYVRWYDCLEAK